MNIAEELYPWQQDLWNRFLTSMHDNRFGHAVMLIGAPGIGLEHFAACMCCYLLDLPPLRDNRDIAEIAHPDLRWVRREQVVSSDGSAKLRAKILIWQIRDLSKYLHGTSAGARKVAVINLVEDCNEQAANALLKPLEELAAHSYVVLLTHAPGRVLPTIRSRCVKFKLDLPNSDEAQTWLGDPDSHQARWALWLAAGAPVAAQQLLETDVVTNLIDLDQRLATMLKDTEFSWSLVKDFSALPPALVNCFLLRILLMASGAGQFGGVAEKKERVQSVMALANHLPYVLRNRLIEDCLARRKLITESSTINHELLLASQFVLWLENLRS